MRVLFRLYRRRFHKLLSIFRMGLISMAHAAANQSIKFWHWSAKWPWFTVLFFAALGVIAVSEYALSIGLSGLSALGVISKLVHWDGSGVSVNWKRPLKLAGSAGILALLGGFIYSVIEEKGDKDWSHLQKPIMALIYHPLIPRHTARQNRQPFVPTPENWAAKQLFETSVPIPPEHPSSRAKTPTVPAYHPVIGFLSSSVTKDANLRQIKVVIRLQNASSFETTARIAMISTWNGAVIYPRPGSAPLDYEPRDYAFIAQALLEVTHPVYLSPQDEIAFLDGTGSLRIRLTAEYPDRGGKTVFLLEGRVDPKLDTVDITKATWSQ
jgi:hypothetical protein